MHSSQINGLSKRFQMMTGTKLICSLHYEVNEPPQPTSLLTKTKMKIYLVMHMYQYIIL